MKYVLVSRNEDGVRIFGIYHDLARANALADNINERIESNERREFEAWQRDPGDRAMPDGYGRVGVQLIHQHSKSRAYRFALGELDS